MSEKYLRTRLTKKDKMFLHQVCESAKENEWAMMDAYRDIHDAYGKSIKRRTKKFIDKIIIFQITKLK